MALCLACVLSSRYSVTAKGDARKTDYKFALFLVIHVKKITFAQLVPESRPVGKTRALVLTKTNKTRKICTEQKRAES